MKWYLFISLFLCSFNTFSQFTVDAGPDLVYCWNGDNKTDTLLFVAIAPTGGTAPYTYSWSYDYYVNYPPLYFHLTASDFLTDTTLLNPKCFWVKDDESTFTLIVIDANGLMAQDSMTIYRSQFNQHLGQNYIHLTLGDSIEMPWANVWGGIPPQTYLWTPSIGITDPTLEHGFWIKPEVDIAYSLIVTDSAGCYINGGISTFVIIEYLNTVAIDENNSINITPNPSTGLFQLENKPENLTKIELYNLNGQLVKTPNIINGSIDLTNQEKGTYILLFYSDVETIYRKIIIE